MRLWHIEVFNAVMLTGRFYLPALTSIGLGWLTQGLRIRVQPVPA